MTNVLPGQGRRGRTRTVGRTPPKRAPYRSGRAGCRGRRRGLGESAYGLMKLDGGDGGPVPAALVALTLNVYFCPGVRPVMVVNGCPLVGGVVRPRQAGQAGVGMTW